MPTPDFMYDPSLRQKAVAIMQQQGMPMTGDNLARAMALINLRGEGVPEQESALVKQGAGSAVDTGKLLDDLMSNSERGAKSVPQTSGEITSKPLPPPGKQGSVAETNTTTASAGPMPTNSAELAYRRQRGSAGEKFDPIGDAVNAALDVGDKFANSKGVQLQPGTKFNPIGDAVAAIQDRGQSDDLASQHGFSGNFLHDLITQGLPQAVMGLAAPARAAAPVVAAGQKLLSGPPAQKLLTGPSSQQLLEGPQATARIGASPEASKAGILQFLAEKIAPLLEGVGARSSKGPATSMNYARHFGLEGR